MEIQEIRKESEIEFLPTAWAMVALVLSLVCSPALLPTALPALTRSRRADIFSRCSPSHMATDSTTPDHLFVAGLGYVGLRVARAALARGWRVSGSARTPEKAAALRSLGIDAHSFDLDADATGLDTAGLASLSNATHVLATVPPVADLDRDPLLSLHRARLLEAEHLRWAGYLSTTSVYGDHAGGWVDETSRTATAGAALNRLAAEAEWLALGETSGGALESHVFRLAGIYGPGRSALHTLKKRVAAAAVGGVEGALGVGGGASTAGITAAITADGGVSSPEGGAPSYVSRIHVDDICVALLSSMARPAAGEGRGEVRGDHSADQSMYKHIYNLADDEPAPRGEVMLFAARLLGFKGGGELETPILGVGGGGGARSPKSSRASRRMRENKRVCNLKMKVELLGRGGGRLKYPTYRDGLIALMGSESETV